MISEPMLLKNKSISPALAIFTIITILPLLLGFIYSLLNTFGLAGIIHDGFTTKYWQQIFQSGELTGSLFYSLLLTVVIVFLCCSTSLWLSINLRSKINSGTTSYFFYMPLALPFIVAAFITFQLLGKSGFFSRILYALQLISDPNQFPDLINDSFGFGILITHTIIGTAFFALLFGNIFKSERLGELAVLAKTLGASNSVIIKKIFIPAILRKAFPSILLYAIFILGSYEIPLLLGTQQHLMISVLIAQKFQRYNLQDIPVAYLLSVIYTVFVIIVLLVLYKKNKLIHETH